jgi:hypothetical protein
MEAASNIADAAASKETLMRRPVHAHPTATGRLAREAAAFAAPLVAASLAIAMFAAAPLLAANPDFAGIWQLDNERSDSLAPGRAGRERPNTLDLELDIAVTGEDLVMNYTMRNENLPGPVQFTQHLITDGKPAEMPDFQGGTRTARVRWRKNKLSVSYTRVTPFGDLDITETWQLSKDGSELQVKLHTRTQSPRPDIRNLVYVRATNVQ